MKIDAYRDAFSIAHLERGDDGVLVVRLHTDGGPLVWGGRPHEEVPELFTAIAADPDNRAVVLTGTGESFIVPNPQGSSRPSPAGWNAAVPVGERLLVSHLQIPVPVIAAVNGPVSIHSEIAVLSDIVICTEDTYFQDIAHFPAGIVPGDGVHVIWPMLLGPNRGRHFLYTGVKLAAADAMSAGVVAEVVTADAVVPRALELAADIVRQDPHVVRATRHVLTRELARQVAEHTRHGLLAEALAALARSD